MWMVLWGFGHSYNACWCADIQQRPGDLTLRVSLVGGRDTFNLFTTLSICWSSCLPLQVAPSTTASAQSRIRQTATTTPWLGLNAFRLRELDECLLLPRFHESSINFRQALVSVPPLFFLSFVLVVDGGWMNTHAQTTLQPYSLVILITYSIVYFSFQQFWVYWNILSCTKVWTRTPTQRARRSH